MLSWANLIAGIVALLHLYFLVLEMFFWEKPLGLRTFRHTKETASASKVLAANMGLYNGFLAAGLLWGLYTQNLEFKLFFLGCVVVAGIFGGLTANKRILWIQALPAVLALLLMI